MKSPIRNFIVVFFCLANFAWAGTRSAIITTTSLTITVRANQVLNVHQYCYIFSPPEPGTTGSIALEIFIGSEFFPGLEGKQVNSAAQFDAYIWPDRPFKVAGPAQVIAPAGDIFKSFITYSIDPR